MPLAPSTRLGSYEILSSLGAGGMGEVYAARDPRLDRTIAIKILPGDIPVSPDRRERFEREARAIGALNHPNIVTIHSIESAGDCRFLTMELVDGQTLDHLIPSAGLALPRFLAIAIPLADALSAAHARGITHRDLKPQNVMVTADGRVKVLDFGLAKLRDDAAAGMASQATRLTTGDGRILGTVAYMSPEQAEGRESDHRTDIFSLGVLFYEMLTCTRPFTGDSNLSILASVVRDTPRSVSEVRSGLPAEAARIVHKMLAKDASRRYQTAADLRVDLEALKDDGHTTWIASTEPAARPARRRYALALGTAALLAALAFLGASLVRTRPDAEPTSASRTPAHVQIPVGDGKAIQNLQPTDEAGSGLALSADGTTLAYVAAGPDAIPRLHTRRVDEDAPRVLEGTERANAPFFSPDGTWIAYVASGRLFKVPIRGGPPVLVRSIVSSASNYSSGHWFEADRLVFTNGVEMFLLDAAGAMQATVASADEKVWAVQSPQVLADGRHVVYERWPTSDQEEEAEIVVQSLDRSAPATTLLKGGIRPRLSGEFLLYQNRSGVYAVRLDARTLTTLGSPIKLPISGIGRWRLASSTSTLAFYSGPPADRLLTWVDRFGHEEPLSLGLAYPTDVALSANDQTVVVAQGRLTHLFWLGDLTRKTVTRLTLDFHSHDPLFLPDGSGLVFRGGRTSPLSLHRIGLVGGPPEPLLTGATQSPSSWTPDGRTLLYSESGDDTGDDLLAMSLETRAVRPILQTRFNESAPALSPDGRWLAYQSNETATGRFEIYLQPYPGPGMRKVVSTDGGSLPTWSHDGRRLYWADLPTNGGSAMWEADVRAGAASPPRRLFSGIRGGSNNRFYAVARDGRFLVIKNSENQQVTSINMILNWDVELRRSSQIR